MTLLDALILFWMFAAFWMSWRAFKYKRQAEANKYAGYMAGYYTALRGRGMSKGEAVRATKRHIEGHVKP